MSMTANTLVAKGIGWVNGSEYGSVIHPRRVAYGGTAAVPPWKQADLFQFPAKNAGRFDPATRMIFSACALALLDAGVTLGDGRKINFGLLGTNASGCVEANRTYFEDYLTGGRTLARANLFVYTLPSSPLAEVAIHFGLQGPVLYIGFTGTPADRMSGLLETGAGWLAEGSVEGLLAVEGDGHSATAVFLGAVDGHEGLVGMDAILNRLRNEF
ncbi:MAG: beta-ketoacyl synthase N-terminal-like domain-containing protein [bacterium]